MEEKQRHSAVVYKEFVNKIRTGHFWRKNKIKYEREIARRIIQERREEIKLLQQRLKQRLPKLPDVSLIGYINYVENSKENAIKENYEWIEPEGYEEYLKRGKNYKESLKCQT